MRRTFLFRCCALLSCLAVAGLLSAAERPRVYAITGATVIPAPGERIDGATIVLRDGLIEAVGADVTAPPDAVEIDGADRWVYAGLIDADSGLGLKAADSGRGGGAPGGGIAGLLRGAPETPPGAVYPVLRIRPETRARDRLQSFDGDRKREMERIRELGFTAVLVRPDSGILRGSSSVILLAAERPVSEMLLRDDVAQHAAFERGRFGQGYPTSLMGTVAALRQVLLDARRYAEWSDRYEADPTGMKRPEFHAASEALARVLGGNQTLIFTTDDARDTLLADRLGREFDLDVAVSVSSYEWEMADRIAATGRALILSVGFPEEPEVDEEEEAVNVSRQQMLRYLDAPKGAGMLERAGVMFALTLNGLKNNADFSKNVRKMIDNGLSEETALAALTTVPASLLGVDRTVGTLSPGKIANLLVADGPLFGEETKLHHVFVDGVQHEIEVKEKPKGDPNAVVDPRGEWSVVIEAFGRTMQRTWTITGEKGAYEGSAETQQGTVEFERVELEGNALTVRMPAQGPRPATEITVIIEGEEFEGTMEMGPRSVELKGSRTSGPEGGVR